jgi:tRNA U34 5-methylaminomethyl-2-thiouridine-forming methyltransferase MnmC
LIVSNKDQRNWEILPEEKGKKNPACPPNKEMGRLEYLSFEKDWINSLDSE